MRLRDKAYLGASIALLAALGLVIFLLVTS